MKILKAIIEVEMIKMELRAFGSGIFDIVLVLTTYHPMYTNPVVNSNHPDPGVLVLPENQGFIFVSTSDLVRPHSSEPVFPISHSLDMVYWELKGYVFEHTYDIKWAEDDYWAPEIHMLTTIITCITLQGIS